MNFSVLSTFIENYVFFRSVSNLLATIEDTTKDGSSLRRLKDATGQDFLFLFDLLAHTCGLESTLRVLTHSDDTFYEICKPNVDIVDKVVLEEDKLKVKWGPSTIERWLQSGIQSQSNKTKHIFIDSYEVTIYPAESVNHTYTVPSVIFQGNF